MRYPNFQHGSRVVFSTGKQTAAVWPEAARPPRRAATSLCGAANPGTRKTFGAARVNTSPLIRQVGPSVELYEAEDPDIRARLQHLVLLVGDAVANVVVEQVLAPDADGDLRHQTGSALELGGVAELGVEQIVAGRRRVEGGKLVLRESVQQIHARQPVLVAIVDATAQAMRRHLGNVGAVGEDGAHEVVLPIDAPHAAPDAGDVVLGQQLRAVKRGVLLRVDDLVELGARSARGEVAIAFRSREALVDKVPEIGVVDRNVEAEVSFRPLEADLVRVSGLDRQVGIADLE